MVKYTCTNIPTPHKHTDSQNHFNSAKICRQLDKTAPEIKNVTESKMVGSIKHARKVLRN